MTVEGPAARLGDLLDAAGRVRVPLADVQERWVVAAPELVGSPEQLGDLAGALHALAAAGRVTLPAARSWDRGTRPPLPRFVTIDANRTTPAGTPWRSHPWCSDLGWVSSLTKLTAAQHEQLLALNRWLVHHRDDAVVPMRVRSAAIFGDEKALDRLLTTSLFGPGRLTLELLACRRYPPPLTITRTGDGPEVLIVENADAYWVALDATTKVNGAVGRVAFGYGRGFEQSIYALAEEPEPPKGLWYWGDLDPDGVAIPTQAAKVGASLGLPALRPATALWLAMAGLPGTEAGKVDWATTTGTWLGPEVWAATAPLREAGGRVAQERLSPMVVTERLADLG